MRECQVCQAKIITISWKNTNYCSGNCEKIDKGEIPTLGNKKHCSLCDYELIEKHSLLLCIDARLDYLENTIRKKDPFLADTLNGVIKDLARYFLSEVNDE